MRFQYITSNTDTLILTVKKHCIQLILIVILHFEVKMCDMFYFLTCRSNVYDFVLCFFFCVLAVDA